MESRLHEDKGPTILGRYELLKRIAVGGMAEIYLAKESGIGFEKLCVVKLILPQLGTEPHLVRMFLDEARVAATLQHQNIVQMYDVGEVHGEYFISMEFLDGEDCRAIYKTMRRKQLKVPYEIAMSIIIGAARGLHYAHEKAGFDGQPLSIVHRDVTPHNVFITYDGGIKLLDFGVAKAANRQNKTTAGTLKGKIPYMSPEQCRGIDLDRRSDIYALGILLYELTTGVRLYSSANDGEFETMRKIVEDDVTPPSVHREGYPGPLERIVLKCLEKDPAKRFQTARDLQSALEDFVRQTRLPVSSITTARFMKEHFRDHIMVWKKAAGDETKLVNAIADKLKESSGSGGEGDYGPGSDPSVQSSSSGQTPSANGEVITNIPTGVNYSGSGKHPISDEQATILDNGGMTTPVPEAVIPGRTEGVSPISVPGESLARNKWPVAMIGLFILAVAIGIVIGLTGRDDEDDDGTVAATNPPADPSDPAATQPAAGTDPGEADDPNTPDEPKDPAAVAPDAAPVPVAPPDAARAAVVPDAARAAVVPDAARPIKPKDEPKDEPKETKDKERDRRTEKKPEKKPAFGELRVTSVPSCELYIDGKLYGSTPRVIPHLHAGKHKVKLRNAQFGINKSYSVFVRANKTTKKRYQFPVKRVRAVQ